MKKNLLKRVLTMGLALVMTMNLAACGKGGEEGGGGGLFGGGDKGQNAAASSSLAKENVYRGEELTLPKMEEGVNVYQTFMKGDKLYMLGNKYSWDEMTGEESQEYYLITTNIKTGATSNVKLTMPEKTEAGDRLTEEYDAYWMNEYYGNFFVGGDGSLYGIKNINEEWSSDTEWKSERGYALCKWDVDGYLLTDTRLDFIKFDPNSWSYLSQAFEGANDTVNLLVSGEKTTFYICDLNGELKKEVTLGEDAGNAFQNFEKVGLLKNGNMFIIYHPQDSWDKTFYAEYDVASGKLGEGIQIPQQVMMRWDYNYMDIDSTGKMLFTSSDGINTYKFGDETYQMKMNYINSDVMIQNMISVIETSEDSFIGLYMDYDKNYNAIYKAATFTYVKPEDIPDKAVLVIGGQWIDSDLKRRVIDFNKTSQDSRFVIRDYSQYNTYDDYNAGITKLNNDIISGNMPDILVNQSYNPIPIENYVSKGLLADIGKLIAEDPDLSKKEYMTNAFEAYSIDGKLYSVVPSFEISTFIAKEKLVGNKGSISMQDVKKIVSQMGPEATAFDTMTQESFLYTMMRYCGSQFVDVSTGECNFNNQDFIDMLEFAKSLPETYEYDDDYWMDYDWSAEQFKYRDEKTLLMSMTLYSFQELSYSLNGYFGEPVSFVGFPSSTGKGSYLMADTAYVLSAKSANLDKAWNFVKYYLDDEYQFNIRYGLPVNKAKFMELSKSAMERPYWEDENGNRQYYDNTMYVNGEEIIIPPLNQQQLDQVIDFMSSVTNRYVYNEAISNIVTEEAGAFLKGQKNASDVAAVIQSRAQIYVDENR